MGSISHGVSWLGFLCYYNEHISRYTYESIIYMYTHSKFKLWIFTNGKWTYKFLVLITRSNIFVYCIIIYFFKLITDILLCTYWQSRDDFFVIIKLFNYRQKLQADLNHSTREICTFGPICIKTSVFIYFIWKCQCHLRFSLYFHDKVRFSMYH